MQHSEHRNPASVSQNHVLNGRLPQRFVLGAGMIVWVALMAALVWDHAKGSTQPPIYDAFTYYSKAKHVWEELLSGHWPGLLNAEPGFRPPATVLMSFPFGFIESFQGFYFRSVFFPIVLVVAATLLALPWRERARSSLLPLVVAAFLSTLSLFFYFEPYVGGPPIVAYWGLVDNFLTGLAAFAAACTARSIRSRSVVWGMLATIIGVLMIYVKPSGTLLAAIVGSTLMIGWALDLLGRAGDGRPVRNDWGRIAFLGVAQIVLLGGAVHMALHSNYLGQASMAYGNASLAVMRSELNLDFAGLVSVIHGGLGPFLPLWAVGSVILLLVDRLAARKEFRSGMGNDRLLGVAAFLSLIAGAWFWLFASGGQTQIRYFTPFLYVGIFLALGGLVGAMSRRGRAVRGFAIAFMLVPVGNIVLLLALPKPSLAWQIASGVNVMSGSRSDSIEQALAVINDTAESTKAVVVYSMASNIADAMYEAEFHLHMLKAAKPILVVRRPIDWQRPSTFRTDEIVNASYILFDPRQLGVSGLHKVPDFLAERSVFEDWARRLSVDDGVERRSAGEDSVLLRIVDPVRLQASLDHLMESHEWRPTFAAANPAKWWSEVAVENALQQAAPAIERVRFGGRFEVRAVIARPLPDRGMQMTMWVRPLVNGDETGWVMLVHAVDAAGQILATADVELGPMSPPSGRTERCLQRKFVLPVGSARIAIGFYKDAALLIADGGDRDWGGKRVLLPLPNPAAH